MVEDVVYCLFVVVFLFLLVYLFEDCQVVFEFVFMVLCVVVDLCVFRLFYVVVVWLQFVYQGFQYGGFIYVVGVQNGDFFVYFQQQVDVFEQWIFIKVFGKGFYFQCVMEQFFILFEVDKWVLMVGGFNFFQFDFVNLVCV